MSTLIPPFRKKPLAHLISTILIAQVLALPTPTHAAPTAGTVIGGTGTITQSGLSTTIQQNTNLLALDWQTFSINANEKVNFLQPGTSSIALNRVLGSDPSNIFGQLNANGHVILANPNGVFFGPTASINVGGLIAAGMTLDPQTFMNGQFTLSTLEGTEGKVVNSGIINASTGGSVSLIGKQVKNEGLILANLGTVSLQSGNEAVVTFDNQGILGIKVTKEVLQTELGVDPAVLNQGTINASSGKIILTASKSRDLFTSAVNQGDIKQAKTAILNDDGTFTLSAGGNIENQGTLNVSGTTAGNITALGENITTSGHILANTTEGTAGTIELTARDTTLLTQNSQTTANSDQGNAGQILILGNKVGLFDQATVTANGHTQGGTVLIGGDQQGQNPYIPNADFLYLGENTQVHADATNQGNGGKVIAFASDTARIYGTLTARGGRAGGDGGFIETSGLRGFRIGSAPDVSAPNGKGGEWLIDPNNISIVAGGGNTNINTATPFVSTNDSAQLGVDLILNALARNVEVTITTGTGGTDGQDGNISFETNLLWDSDRSAATPVRDSTLTLSARNNISTNGFNISASDNVSGPTLIHRQLNLVLNADSDNSGTGSVDLGSSQITTNGGRFESTAASFVSTNAIINTTGAQNLAGGAINITATNGDIQAGALTANGGTADRNGGTGVAGLAGGVVALTSNNGSVTVSGAINVSGTTGDFDPNAIVGQNGGDGGSVTVTAANGIAISAVTANGGAAAGDNPNTGRIHEANGGRGGSVSLIGSNITLDGALSAVGGMGVGRLHNSGANQGVGGDGGTVTTNANVTNLNNDIDVRGAVTNQGALAGQDGTATVNITGTDGGATISHTANFNSPVAINANTATGTQTLTGANRTNTWVIDGTGSGNLNSNNITFTGIETFTGGSGDDTFTVTAANVTATLNGGGGTNSLTDSAGGTNVWTIMSPGGGTLVNGTGTVGFSGMRNLTGGSGTDTFRLQGGTLTGNVDGGSGTNDRLTGDDGTNSWSVDGENTGTVTGISGRFLDIENLTGGSGDDTFTFTGTGNITGAIDAGAHATGDTVNLAALATVDITLGGTVQGVQNAERIVGNNTNSTLRGGIGGYVWTITGENDGTVAGVINFENFNNLVGGTGNDSFTFDNAASRVTGYIDGNTGTDSLDVTALTNANISIGTTGAGTTAKVTRIEQITANAAVGDTLTGADIATRWDIINPNSGTVTDATNGTTAFSGFDSLIGGVGDDTFAFTDGVLFAGAINAGGNTATGDAVDLSAFTVVNVTASGTTYYGVNNVERLIGNNTNSTLTGPDGTIAWTINGENDGTVNGVQFEDFNNLVGGAGSDTFTFDNNSADVTGLLSGGVSTGTDTDTVIVSNNRTTPVTIRVGTAPTAGAVDITGIESVNANTSGSIQNTLIGDDTTNVWAVNGTNAGLLNGSLSFSGFARLVGGAGADTFALNGTDTVTGRIDGGAGTDAVSVSMNSTNPSPYVVRTYTDSAHITDTGTSVLLNIVNVEGVNASGTTYATLRGDDVTNLWEISGNRTGTLNKK